MRGHSVGGFGSVTTNKVIATIAGDIFGKTPIWGALRMFKAIYYMVSLGNFRRSFAGWKRHRVNIRDTGPLRGETITDQK